MADDDDECHVAFLPVPSFSHMMPMVEMAVFMASRGVKTTIITTKSFAERFSTSIHQTINYHHQIALHIYDEPKPTSAESTGGINLLDIISAPQETVHQFLLQSQPNCIIADTYYIWATKVAAKFNIPRITFDASGFFPKCVGEMIRLYEPEKSVSSDSDQPFIVPHLPHEIAFTRKEILPESDEFVSEFALKLQSDAGEAERTSYGIIVNSFYELEPEYVCLYRQVTKRRAWHIGPVSLFCKNAKDKLERPGEKLSGVMDSRWLDSKAPNSVVYICFGTLAEVASSQLYEIAMGLEACNYDFIWVIKEAEETSTPQGFEERMREKGKGLIVKGWAPQALILDHVSVGGFITHCGWNSTLEGICGGVAMLTWPVAWDQLYNAKLVTDVLKTGVSIGEGKWSVTPTIHGVKRDAIQKGIERIMSPEEGGDMRRRAQILKENAKAAIEEGGSSVLDLTAFIAEMKANKSQRTKGM